MAEARKLELAWIDTPENHAQRDYLHSFRYRNFLLGGRGLGKTFALVTKNAIYCLGMNPGCISYLTERTGPEVRDTLLPIFRQLVPQELYYVRVVSSTSYDIHWKNGSITRLRSRQARNSIEDPPFRGPSCSWIGHDELAIDKDGNKMMRISEAMLRGGNGPWCIDGTTTPRIGWLYDYLQIWGLTGDGNVQVSKDETTVAFYGKTRDNPHNNDLDGRLRETYSAEFAAQELEAKWVSLSGRIWKAFLELHWPKGNLHNHGYDPSRPYILAVDLGVRSAWGIWQRIPATDEEGRTRGRGVRELDVLVAEYVPNHGNARDLVATIDKRFGRPAKVIAGMDINTRSLGDGIKPSYFFTSKWPGIHISTPSGFSADKEVQHWQAQALLCNAYNQRRICVSTRLDTDTQGRGIMDMIRLDSWPEGVLRSGSFFEKDKATGGPGIEDVRDMFLYYIICQYPPEFRQERRVG